jgi:hypothetical protein
VQAEHIEYFLLKPDNSAASQEPVTGLGDAFHWHAAALARVMRVPEGFMRETSRERIEDHAREHGITEITLERAEQGLAEACKAMETTMHDNSQSPSRNPAASKQNKCPFAKPAGNMGVEKLGPESKGPFHLDPDDPRSREN